MLLSLRTIILFFRGDRKKRGGFVSSKQLIEVLGRSTKGKTVKR